MKQLRSEIIYDATVDEEEFAALPGMLADAFGARSCVIHWWHAGSGAQVMAHNGYFPDGEMQNYAENFTTFDLWSHVGLQPARQNKVTNLDEFVDPAEYEKGIFYNEWIRAMGDDTFHCLGTAVKTRWGYGFVGLHRGRRQGGFTDESVKAMERTIVHLRRMLTMRGTLEAQTIRASRAEAVLDACGDALLTLAPDGGIVHANASAERILRRADGIACVRGKLHALDPSADNRMKKAIAAASAAADPQASSVALPRSPGGQYDAAVAGLRIGGSSNLVVMTLRDPDSVDPTVPHRLMSLYGLSQAEADVAVRLADGATPAQIADERRVAGHTVRFQLKSLCQKMGCRRQAEVAALVKSLPAIRPRAD